MGNKYTYNKFCDMLALDETVHQNLYANTPKQNEITEWKYRHIVKIVHS